MKLTYAQRREYKKMIEGLSTIEIYCKVILGKDARGGMGRFPTGSWKAKDDEAKKRARQRARECTRYLIGTILRWDREEVCKSLRSSTFNENYLGGMLKEVYGHSPYKAISDAFPEEAYDQWELKSCPQDYWNEKTAGEAIRWLIEKKMKWTFNQVCELYCSDFLVEQGFSGLLGEDFCEGSPYRLLSLAYPEKYKQWQLLSCPRHFWEQDTNKKEAIQWLLKKKSNPTKKDFYLNGMDWLLRKYFKSSVTEAIAFATAS